MSVSIKLPSGLAMSSQLRGWEWLILLPLAVVPAVVPITIAYIRHASNRVAVLVVALLASWTCIGWIAAIAMAATGRPDSRPGTLSDPQT